MRHIAIPILILMLLLSFSVLLWRDGAQRSGQQGLVGQQVPLDHPLIGQGKPVLINFWFSTCAPCRAEHPILMDLAAQGIEVIGVNRDVSQVDATAFLDELGDPYAAKMYDPRDEIAQRLQIVNWPTSILVLGNGIVQAVYGPLIDPEARGDMRLVSTPEKLFEDPEREAQAQALFSLINCLDCAANTVRESGGNFAIQMRKQVRLWMAEGQSREQIRERLIDRYGQAIWLKPPLNGASILLYALPLFALGLGVFVLVRRGRA